MAFLTVTDDGRDTWFPDSPRAYAGSVARCQEFSRTRTRDSAFYPSHLSCVIRLEGHRLFCFGIVITCSEHALAGLDFLRSTAHDDVAAALAVALTRKAEVAEGTSQPHVAELLHGVAADNLHSPADGHELAALQFARLAEIDVHQLTLLLRRLIMLVVTAEPTNLVLVEPELEAFTIQPVGLGVDALVVEGIIARIADMLNLERQPAAVARGVTEELHVVARPAERGDVLAVLVVVGVGRPFVDRWHGDRRLQLVQVAGRHRVQLLAAHQSVLRQR